ncbi:hypothetical protein [Tessaracoccus coleopterorum]|uniref:hypothetical protein n=1 Tax=Tessaracoccus coleopterorum TaxID=2714950 RepID=UPI001E36EF72|nr:hypothetical protein [Tessaracoccus coleopterorum]
MESRVMVSARRFRDLEVSGSELPELTPVHDTTRELAVAEMLDYQELRAREEAALDAPLLLDDGRRRHSQRESG